MQMKHKHICRSIIKKHLFYTYFPQAHQNKMIFDKHSSFGVYKRENSEISAVGRQTDGKMGGEGKE